MLRSMVAVAGQAAPNGSTEAVFLREDGGEAAHDMHQLFSPVIGGGFYQFTCHIKAVQRRWVSLCLWDHGEGQSGGRVWFDLDAGVIGPAELIGNGSARLRYDLADMGDGWFRCGIACQISLSASTGMFGARIGFDNSDSAGNGDSGVLVWAPMIQHRQSINLLQGGGALGLAPWVLANAAVRERTRRAADGDSSVMLRELRKGGEHTASQAVPSCASGLFFVFSCLAKPAGRDRLRLSLLDPPALETGMQAWFDLGRGLAGAQRRLGGRGGIPAVSVSPMEDGWYRCVLSGPWLPARSGTTCVAQIALGAGEGEASYPGDGKSGMLIRDARLETRAQPG